MPNSIPKYSCSSHSLLPFPLQRQICPSPILPIYKRAHLPPIQQWSLLLLRLFDDFLHCTYTSLSSVFLHLGWVFAVDVWVFMNSSWSSLYCQYLCLSGSLRSLLDCSPGILSCFPLSVHSGVTDSFFTSILVLYFGCLSLPSQQ